MEDVRGQVEDVMGNLNKALTEQAAATGKVHHGREAMRELGRLIASRKATTRDPIRDFVIVRHNVDDATMEALYRQLEKEITRCLGQMVLVVTRREGEARLYAAAHAAIHDLNGDKKRLEEELSFGLISAPDLILDVEAAPLGCKIPTGGIHVSCTDRYRGTVRVLPGDVGLGNYDLQERNEVLEGQDVPYPIFKLEIVVGDKEVNEWCHARTDSCHRYDTALTQARGVWVGQFTGQVSE